MAIVALLICLGVAQATPPAAPEPAPGHWPQYRGPNRDGVSNEKNLLHEWPLGGPPLLWKTTGIGEGVGTVSVAGGLIFVHGFRDRLEFLTALDGRGKVVWCVELGPDSGEKMLMRYVSHRSVTVDDGLLFFTTWQGHLLCLESTTGRILWRSEYQKDLGVSPRFWGFGDAPLVDGKLVIGSPGGPKGSLAAFDKATGVVVWQSAGLTDILHSPIVAAEIDGVRQYVALTYKHVAGVSAATGEVLWMAGRDSKIAVVSAPVVYEGGVFVSSGFGVGGDAFGVSLCGREFLVTELYHSKEMENQHGGMVQAGGFLYGSGRNQLVCLNLKTGEVAWQHRSVGTGPVVAAEGMLILRSTKGEVALVELTPEGYRQLGWFMQPDRTRELAVAHPVLAGGRLYLRDQDTLYCYQIGRYDYKAPEQVWNIAGRVGKPVVPSKVSLPPAGGKAPDAAFVATPQDVVDKMIELAKITKDDLLIDLGSGDGRILLTASKNHGCRTVGYEINAGLVWEARQKARQAKLDNLVTIEEKDLFTADLSAATVVTLYLGVPNNAKLLPKLRQLKPGARIVSHAHLLGDGGPKPDLEVKMKSVEDHEEHTIYMWTTPLGDR